MRGVGICCIPHALDHAKGARPTTTTGTALITSVTDCVPTTTAPARPPTSPPPRRPNHAKGLYLKGRAHMALGDHELEGAVEAFGAAARAAPKDAGEGDRDLIGCVFVCVGGGGNQQPRAAATCTSSQHQA
jgi:hypothetical protein